MEDELKLLEEKKKSLLKTKIRNARVAKLKSEIYALENPDKARGDKLGFINPGVRKFFTERTPSGKKSKSKKVGRVSYVEKRVGDFMSLKGFGY